MGVAVMTIEKIDDRRLLIALSEDDMKNLKMSFQDQMLNNQFFINFLKKFTMLTKKEMGESANNKRILVDIVSHKNEFFIFVTFFEKVFKDERKIYRIKGDNGPFIFCFNNVEDLINAVSRICKNQKYISKSQLLEKEEKYYLIIYVISSVFNKFNFNLCEYGRLYGKGKLNAARLVESGSIIISENAIKKIINYFCEK